MKAPNQRHGAQTPDAPTLHVRIPPDARHARTVREALLAFSALHRVGPDDAEALLFAVGEALANAIEHGAPLRDIEVTVAIERSAISAHVADYGAGFAPTGGYIQLPQGLTERGRGIPIMQRFADRFEVDSSPGQGTVVRLVRYRRSESANVDQERAAVS